jgi:hypothetical protein
MFIVRGTQDAASTQQFRWAWLAYGAGQWVSAAYFLLFLWGVWLAWRQRSALLVLAIPIAYVPLTICFVLTNMRYTITVQPLMFGFVAGALVRMLKSDDEVVGAGAAAGSHSTRTPSKNALTATVKPGT